MREPKSRPATYADIEALPPHVVGEILFGVLHTHPRPAPRPIHATSMLLYELMEPFDRKPTAPERWLMFREIEVQIGATVIVPDIAGWRRTRMPRVPDADYIDLAPDWVVETLEPHTRQVDRTDKLAIYADFGVGHAWYVDPTARTLEVFALTGADAEWASKAPKRKWLLAATFKDDDAVTAPPFEAHTFTLSALWAE